jgi:hypothetical protein
MAPNSLALPAMGMAPSSPSRSLIVGSASAALIPVQKIDDLLRRVVRGGDAVE